MRTGRPGPVHVDITKDALQQETDAPHPTTEQVIAGLPGFRPNLGGHPRQLKLIAEEIAKAHRPIILAGHGILIANATEELRALAEKARIPVAWTLLGIGAMDETHPLAYGYMGMHGWKHVNRAIQASDLIVAVGMRFDDRVTGSVRTYAPYARIIHVDIDPAEIGKNVAVDIPVVGDVKHVMVELNKELRTLKEPWDAIRKSWQKQIDAWRDERPLTYEPSDEVIKPQFVIEKLYELTGGDAIIVTDVGQHQMWAAQFFKYDTPRNWLSSGGLGTMGYGLPAAIGAKLACPDKPVACVSGDGSFQMCVQELMTATVYGLPVISSISPGNGNLGTSFTVTLTGSARWMKTARSYGVTSC